MGLLSTEVGDHSGIVSTVSFSSIAFCVGSVCFPYSVQLYDALAEWLRRRPAKPLGFARTGSNPVGVESFAKK